ncbi:MAG: type II toxin-antitoxin system VapB family antitoxin [Bacteriovorax sp.]|nr:type II toxin-antitoxin system VapB family antitoxin [Rhizobacter sp.]
MKTTLDISDPLLDQVRKIAARDGDTLRSLVEQGLRKVVAERNAKAKPFKLKDGSVGTAGASSGYEKLSSQEMRALMYEGRGG